MDSIKEYIIPIDKAIQIILGALVGIIFASVPFSQPEYQNQESLFAIIAFCLLILALISIGFITSIDFKINRSTEPKFIAFVIITILCAIFYPLYCYSDISGVLIPEQMIYQIFSLSALVMLWLAFSYFFK